MARKQNQPLNRDAGKFPAKRTGNSPFCHPERSLQKQAQSRDLAKKTRRTNY
jgi:hypothetical protein